MDERILQMQLLTYDNAGGLIRAEALQSKR